MSSAAPFDSANLHVQHSDVGATTAQLARKAGGLVPVASTQGGLAGAAAAHGIPERPAFAAAIDGVGTEFLHGSES